MNIFKQIINKLNSDGNVKSFELDDRDTTVFSDISKMPDVAKSYLFQIKFEFQEEFDKELTDYLMLTAKSINILPYISGQTYDLDTNTHSLNQDDDIVIRFDVFEDFKNYNFWMVNFNNLKPFKINVLLYNNTLNNVIKKFTYNNVKLSQLSSLVLNTNSDERIIFDLIVKADSITMN